MPRGPYDRYQSIIQRDPTRCARGRACARPAARRLHMHRVAAGAPDRGALAGAPDSGAPAGEPDRGAVHLHAHTATGVNPARHADF